MQGIWQEVSDSKSVYNRLFKFGIRTLHSKECGLYEVSGMMLGESMCEKSVTVMWTNVAMPHKQNWRLKDKKLLNDILKVNPNSENIFEADLLGTFYPNRPAHLDDLCRLDFMANYNYYSKDANGLRKYRKLQKARLVNHKLFNPEKEEQRQDYFYSLILLFAQFRDESCLLGQNKTAEKGFNRLLPQNDELFCISRETSKDDEGSVHGEGHQ